MQVAISNVIGFNFPAGSWQTIPNEPEGCYTLIAEGPAQIEVVVEGGAKVLVNVEAGRTGTLEVCGPEVTVRG